MWVKSQYGLGSSFGFRIKLQNPNDAPASNEDGHTAFPADTKELHFKWDLHQKEGNQLPIEYIKKINHTAKGKFQLSIDDIYEKRGDITTRDRGTRDNEKEILQEIKNSFGNEDTMILTSGGSSDQ